MVNIYRAWEVLKIPLVLPVFAITLKGINTLIGQSKDERKSRYDLTSPEGTTDHDIKLQSVSWSLAEFRHNRIVQSPHENYFNVCRQHKEK